jgi:hypothetical protein
LCDLDIVEPAWEEPASMERLLAGMGLHDVMGSVPIADTPGATVAWIESGFGDGEFPVFELVASDGSRVGVEVQFIAPDEEYPF